jgi:anti-sigma regulatory factor (Ser/Thr protein kinase)
MAEVFDAAPRTTVLQDKRRSYPTFADHGDVSLGAIRVEQEFGLRVRDMDPAAWDMDMFTLPSTGVHCQEARARVDRVAEAMGLATDTRADIMLAVGEAVSNAVEHGNGANPEGSFTVCCVCCMAAHSTLYVSVSDPGPGFQPDEIPSIQDALLRERGRGIHCINAVMDEVTFDFSAGTTVRMTKASR